MADESEAKQDTIDEAETGEETQANLDSADEQVDPTSAEFDPKLLSLMIGELGTPSLIEEKCHQIQLSLAQVLMLLFHDKNSLPVEASSGSIVQAPRSELLTAIEGEFCYCEASIETWSQNIAIYCNNDLIISIVECLMGGDDPDNIEPVSRPLSNLELELSKVFFEIVNEALKAAITRNSTLEQKVETPQLMIPDIEDETYKDFHAVAISLDVKFGKLESHVTIIVPQSRVIKTEINLNAARKRKSAQKTEWSEKLSKQVFSSDIVLQANIGLERLKLQEVGRLQVGDVLRFEDEGEPNVVLHANGRELYNCALGKSANKYMIKVKEPHGDEDWKSNL